MYVLPHRLTLRLDRLTMRPPRYFAMSRADQKMIKSVFKWTWLAAHLVLFIGFSYFSFSRNYGLLSYGQDGVVILVHIMYQWIWAPVAVGLYSSPFQGLSDLWWGT